MKKIILLASIVMLTACAGIYKKPDMPPDKLATIVGEKKDKEGFFRHSFVKVTHIDGKWISVSPRTGGPKKRYITPGYHRIKGYCVISESPGLALTSSCEMWFVAEPSTDYILHHDERIGGYVVYTIENQSTKELVGGAVDSANDPGYPLKEE